MKSAYTLWKEEKHIWETTGQGSLEDHIIRAINKDFIEAIMASAERAKSEWIRYGTNMGHSVERASILSLLNEIK